MTPAIDITAEQQEAILSLLERYLPGTTAWAYGSRVRRKSRPTSDLDLVVFATPEQDRWVGDLREAFEEGDLPFPVDLFVWDEIPENFRERIEAERVVLVEKQGWGKGRDWPMARLGDCIEINDSAYSLKEEWPFVNYLDTGNITENRIAEIQHLVVGRDKIPSRARRKARPGEIVYSTVRPNQRHFGLLRDIPENFLASTGFSIIAGKEGVACTDFIYWFLAQDHIVELLHTIAEHSTTAYPSIRPSDIEGLEIELPSLPEQRAIAHVLGTLDDRIELNRRMNETLETMAQAIFKDWFVDFGPTRAKLAGRAPYLPEPLWSLFPDRLTDSEIGGIPEGWDAASVNDLIDLNPKRTLRKGQISPYLDMANMPTKGHVPDKWIDRPFSSGMRFVNGDTLLARITPCLENGKTAYVDFLPNGSTGWGSTEYIVLRPKPPLPCEFAYCLARSGRFREFAIQNMTGTSGRQRVPAKALAQFVLPSPPDTVGAAFGQLTRPLIARSSEAVVEARTLSALRDALLPYLVSGQLRVKGAG